jgi:hypothetical protein
MSKQRNLAVRFETVSRHWCFLGLAAFSALLSACDNGDSDATTVGTETNWLTRCEDSEECSVGSCVCGLCTFECEQESDCGEAPGPSRCAASNDADYAARCGNSVPGICLANSEATTEPTNSETTADSVTGTSVEGESDDTATATAGSTASSTGGAGNSGPDTAETEGTPDDTVSQGGATGGTSGGVSSSLDTAGTGGTLGNGSNGGSGGTLGNGGSGNSLLCPAECDEVCSGDVCGCSCSPEWSACEVPSDCVVATLDCCTCSTLDAVNTSFAAEAMCSQSGVDCVPCSTAQDPYRVASCINNRCALVQLDETPLTECTLDQDCRLAEPLCCSSCNPAVDPLSLIALNVEEGGSLSELLCAPQQGCDACLTPFPEGYTAVCNAGHCAVEQAALTNECVAPAGTAVNVQTHGSIECFGPANSGLTIEPTLITSTAELEDIITRCASFDASPVPSFDFETGVLFAAVVGQRPTITVAYAIQTESDILIGIDAPAYCGGAAPGDGLIFVEMVTPPLPVVQDTCFTGMCSGPPVP